MVKYIFIFKYMEILCLLIYNYIKVMFVRIILHVDVNNAFLSWSAVDMLKRGSSIDIRNRYAVIGGDEEARKGVVLAKSNKCKALGVVTGESLYSARKKCPMLEVYKPNHDIYKYYSDMMYNYLLGFTNIIERYSIDECFLDYTGSVKLFGDPIEAAYKIKEDIKNKFGFTVNVGVGNNKLEAKMASDFSKPDKVHTLFDNEIKDKMWKLEIEDLFMIGKSTSKKLREMGINTIGDLALSDCNILYHKFKKFGNVMWNYANGIDNSEVVYEREDAKSISSSTTLSYNYNDRDLIYNVFKGLSMEVGKKLRDKGMFANVISIWIKYADFEKVSKQVKIDNAINTDEDIFKYSKVLFDKIWDIDRGIRGLCVGVSGVNHKRDRQLSLFSSDNVVEDRDNLQKTLDDIREKFGNNSIMYASMVKNDKK